MYRISPFPIVSIKKDYILLKNGIIFDVPHYCSKHCNNQTCKSQYTDLNFSTSLQFKECHKGFLIAYIRYNNETYIFSGIVDQENMKLHKKIFKKHSSNNHVTRKSISLFIQQYKSIESSYKQKIQQDLKNLIQPYHDIKRLIGTITANIEKLAVKQATTSSLKDAMEHIDGDLLTIYKTSQLIETYTSLTDSLANPRALKSGKTTSRGVYKSFDKMTKILKSKASTKKLNIKLTGQCFKEIPAYASLDLLPFIFLDNAIKYSIKNNEIAISFKEEDNFLYVQIENIGCHIPEKEQKYIFKKFQRGQQAHYFSSQGSGIGLYLASIIAKHHHAKINVTSELLGYKESNNDIAKVTFSITFSL